MVHETPAIQGRASWIWSMLFKSSQTGTRRDCVRSSVEFRRLVWRAEMQKVLLLVAILLASPIISQALARDWSANVQLPGCRNFVEKTNNEYFAQGNCAGLLEGILYLAEEYGVCAPANIDTRQVARIVVRYIDHHPARLDNDFRQLAVEAFREAWPCRR